MRLRIKRGVQPIAKDDSTPRVNEQIKALQVRLVGPKYRYDQQKRLKESKKKQHVIANKEVRMRPSIGDHDLETKINQAIKFLQDGSRLKISVRFRGREMTRMDLGANLLDRVVEMLSEYAEIDKSPTVEGRSMIVYFVPK
jgi:translation initiation factor IF-3